MKKINLVMAGGGTGGHVLPIQSLIEHIDQNKEYNKQINTIFRFGTKKSFEKEVFDKLKQVSSLNLNFIPILSGKYRRETLRRSRARNIRDIFLFGLGVFQSLYFLVVNRVNVIFCKGGYVALPVTIAGWILRKKIFVHESDVKPGIVNKISSRFAKINFTGFDGVLKNSITIGQILNDGLLPNANDYSKKGQKGRKTKLLIMGGSQGSKKLYNTFLKLLEQEKSIQNYEITLILGRENKELKKQFSPYKNVQCLDFVDQKTMGKLLYRSDVSITRAGTTSLAEHKLFGLKIVMVPIPRTHDQYDNAKYYVRNYGDILLDSKDPNYKKKFADTLKKLSHYKKGSITNDLQEQVTKAKDTIIQYILK